MASSFSLSLNRLLCTNYGYIHFAFLIFSLSSGSHRLNTRVPITSIHLLFFSAECKGANVFAIQQFFIPE